eukprot:gene14070-18877_t
MISRRIAERIVAIFLLPVVYCTVDSSLLWSNASARNLVEKISIQNYCPVSFQMDVKRNRILGYPIDIFGGPEISLPSSTDQTQKIHLCVGVPERFCPWNKALMDETKQSMTKKPTKHSLCRLLKYLVLGGSATSGHAAWGCCCDSNIDSNCSPIETDLLDDGYCGTSEFKDVAHSCSWPHFLTNWLKTYLSSDRVKLVDMASSGRNVLSQLDDLENSRNLAKFTSNDIVILDHSVNDNHMFFGEGEAKALEMGLEKLINVILRLSVSASWPTIIIVDYWPFAHHFDRVDNKIDHSKWYKEIASRYEIPLLSLRDLAESNYMASNFSWLKPVLDSSINSEFCPLHPPWFVHLTLADMIGVYLQEEFARCLPQSNSTRSTKEMIISTLDHYLSKSPNAGALSESKYDISNSNRTFLLNLKAYWAFYPNKREQPSIGSLLTPVKRCTSTSVCSFDEWNLVSEKKQRPIPVPLVGRNSSLYDLRVVYLNTYENAGAVHVYVCGKLIGTIDGLWKMAVERHYSTESFVHFKIDIMNICNNKNKHRLLSVKKKQSNNSNKTVLPNNNIMGNITFIPIRYVEDEDENQRILRKN